MKLTKRQKIGSIAMLIGMAILIIDRVFILPEAAPALETQQYMDEYSVKDGSETTAKQAEFENLNISAAEQIKQKLETLYKEKNLDMNYSRDAFTLPAVWARDAGPKIVVEEAAAGSAFARKHQLKAVIMDVNNIGVYIDNNFLALGEEIDGYILIEVKKESAVFEYDGKKVELKLVIIGQ